LEGDERIKLPLQGS